MPGGRIRSAHSSRARPNSGRSRTLREYELTGGLIEGTDAEGLATLEVILFGINWQLAPGVAQAVSQAVQGAVGLLNEWWVHSHGDPGNAAVCQLMLAEPPMYAYHTPVPCVTNTFRQARFAPLVSVPAEDYLMRVLAWLAEPRRAADV